MVITKGVNVVASKDKAVKKAQAKPVASAPKVKAPAPPAEVAIYPAPIAVQEAWERGDYAWIARALGVEEQLVGHYSLATLLVMAREKCRG